VEVGLSLSLRFIILAGGTRRAITGLVDEEMRKSINHKRTVFECDNRLNRRESNVQRSTYTWIVVNLEVMECHRKNYNVQLVFRQS
jgi:hypothetical protein